MAENYAIPITVGVVGHLDMLATDYHKHQVTQLFIDLASHYPNSPVSLFSSIAEGADRLVAKIFLDLKRSDPELGKRFSLIVPTPFTPDEYKKDFTEDSAREFDQLMKQAERTFCVSCEDFVNDRPLQYFKTGKFVADSSIILIALWDGGKGKKGGTADIVRHKIAGDDDNVEESTFEYDGTVFILSTKRAGTAGSVQQASDSDPLSLNQVLRDDAIREALEKIERINSESILIDSKLTSRSQSFMFNEMQSLNDLQHRLLGWYSIFDILSLMYRKSDTRISIWLFSIGLFLITALQIYSNLFPTRITLGIVMLFFIVATLIYLYSRERENHKKYLYNRTLAEALRIQFYWNLAGINKNVSEYFLRIHRKDFTWAKHIISAMFGLTYKTKAINAETINILIDNWVKNQSDFFRKSVAKMTSQVGLFNIISNASFIVSFVLLVSVFFFEDYYTKHDYLNLLQVIVGTLLGIFALIKGYLQLKGYEQLINQYELMKVIYDRAESKIIETDTYGLDPEQRNDYLKELFFVVGKEALIENGNWYLLLKKKEPEIEGI